MDDQLVALRIPRSGRKPRRERESADLGFAESHEEHATPL